jgi:hypothetical protein
MEKVARTRFSHSGESTPPQQLVQLGGTKQAEESLATPSACDIVQVSPAAAVSLSSAGTTYVSTSREPRQKSDQVKDSCRSTADQVLS